MTKNKISFILFILVTTLLLSGCQQPDNDTQEQPMISNTPAAPAAPADEAASPKPDAIPEEPEPAHPLLGVVETVTAKLPKNASNAYNRAVLLDFNEDGVDELLLTYCGVNRREQRLEIWTVREEKPVLLWEETLFESAGGPAGGVRMVTKGDTPYLCVYSTNFGARGIADNGEYIGLLKFYSPTYQTEDGLYCQSWLSYDFYGPDNRTPAPDEREPASRLIFDGGTECSVEEFQAWMAAFDQSAPSILHVGGVLDKTVGMTLSEISAILSQTE